MTNKVDNVLLKDTNIQRDITRAQRSVFAPGGWREGIEEALSYTTRIEEGHVEALLSPPAVEAFKELSPSRFGKLIPDLNDDEMGEIASSMGVFLTLGARDIGILLEGGDPKNYGAHAKAR